MIVVSSREFRANQGKYLGMAASGEDIVLKSRGNGGFKIVPVTSDDTLVSREEFYAKIEKSAEQICKGECFKQKDGESIDDFVERLLCTE